MPVVRAPGRVNLIGDHTDYQEGLCLPVPLELGVSVSFESGGDVVDLTSIELGERVRLPLPSGGAGPGRGDHPRSAEEPTWFRIVGEAVRTLGVRHGEPSGLRGEVRSTLPIGSGLASSAAFTIAVLRALGTASGWELSETELVVAAREVEERATGVPCGFLDQLAIVKGRPGHALLCDCRDRSTTLVPIPASIDILIVHSGTSRSLAHGEYAQRRAECEAAARDLGLASLRDASPDMVVALPRARHVVSENGRVLRFVEALTAGDLGELGVLMNESHRSLRDDFDVSTPELDALVSELVDHGAAGARLTGAGFGGCVVAVAARGDASAIASTAGEAYEQRTGHRPVAWILDRGPAPIHPDDRDDLAL